MTIFKPTEHPHRRLNLRTGEWTLVSSHRTKRPWQGQVEQASQEKRPSYDPGCYLCPGNKRAGDAAFTGGPDIFTPNAKRTGPHNVKTRDCGVKRERWHSSSLKLLRLCIALNGYDRNGSLMS